MRIRCMRSFSDELAKIAAIVPPGLAHAVTSGVGPWGHAAELGGLGILAAPSIQKLRKKPMKKRNEQIAEVAGLGTLAAPSLIGVGKHLLKHGSAVTGKKHMPAHKMQPHSMTPAVPQVHPKVASVNYISPALKILLGA